MAKGEFNRIVAIAFISTVVFVGNIFSVSWTWGHNPWWTSIIITIVSICSIFAWAVAIALFTED